MSVELCVNLTGQLEREVEVQLSTVEGVAIAGEDYQNLSQPLTFLEQELICRGLEIFRDFDVENSEEFTASISSTDSAVNITVSTTNITILDSNRKLMTTILETVYISSV